MVGLARGAGWGSPLAIWSPGLPISQNYTIGRHNAHVGVTLVVAERMRLLAGA